MKNRYKKGFTLIELLVVIAIIGIISGVILTFLMSARAKSKDSAIKQELNHLRTQANIHLPIGTPALNCNEGIFLDNTIEPLLDAIPGAKLCAHSASTDFIVIAPLVSDPDKSWCVDSSNNSRQINTIDSLPEGYVCPLEV